VLFATIGVTWGVGDGSTTFNVPDGRGRAIIGAGTGSGLTARTLGAVLGSEVITSSALAAHTHTGPSHTHTFSDTSSSDGAHTHSTTLTLTQAGSTTTFVKFESGTAEGTANDLNPVSSSDGAHTHTISGTTSAAGTGNTGSTGSGAADGNMSPALVGNWMIKT
jgi:microcystin-dependent protein